LKKKKKCMCLDWKMFFRLTNLEQMLWPNSISTALPWLRTDTEKFLSNFKLKVRIKLTH
jgi:hypothetical protein